MAVGMSVGGKVTVGDGEAVGVSVGVGVSPEVRTVGSFGTAMNVTTATMPITKTSAPIAAGRLNRISGMRVAWTDFSVFFAALGSGCAANSVPQTRQRTAFSLNRVPQVGQTFVLLEAGSGVIRGGIIPLNDYAFFERFRLRLSKRTG